MTLFCFVIVISATLRIGDFSVSYGTMCTSNSTCMGYTFCLPGVGNIKRCLCKENKFRTSRETCNFISDLRVYQMKADSVTPKSVKLKWTSPYVEGLSAIFNVSYNNTYQLGDENGVTIDNLSPDTQYKFTVQVIISNTYEFKYGPFITYSANTSAVVTVSSSSASHTTQSHVDSTDLETESDSNSMNISVANMSEPGAKETDSISLKVFLSVTISLCSLLTVAIVIIVILMRSKWRSKKKRIENVYDTTNICDLETHQYCDTTNLNKSEYQEVTDLACKHYSN
ncbi:hypothetical protein Bpfe_020367 [Biomphalaria pfeifferi]|uniref:Fibronectin type-III domain-containing protein n=1 Tax=Biomphalaria pfeifferi TaxID=112525 RepID=A0AAD8F4X2_BIOPF|nr:hypothetical protein Bpfe_020367 [Biomphalaria pfeifferi]